MLVVDMEEKWGMGHGKEKADEAATAVIKWLNDQHDLNWLQRQMLTLLVRNLLAAIVEELNERMGHDWLDKAGEIRDTLEEKTDIL